jgi:hypothetical protein
MSLDAFYDLTIYEWILQVEGYIRREKKEYEKGWIYTREIVATILNASGRYSKVFNGSDVYKFNTEEIEVDVKKVEEDNKEYFKKMKSRFGSKIKKDGKK